MGSINPINKIIMKKIFFAIITGISLNGYCQTIFDVFNYTEPKEWKKEIKSSMVSYTNTDAQKGSYCIISLYANTTGKETLQASFDNEWQELVATNLGVTTKPQCAKGENLNDWETMTGLALFEFNGGKSAAILSTFSNSGKAASILIVFNNQAYQPDVDSFLKKLSLSKPDAISASNGTGALSDYVFIPPPGFSKVVKANEIVLSAVLTDQHVPMIISVLPMQPSSGSLETDMNTVFFSVFKGWNNYNHWSAPFPVTYKGTTTNGYNYILEHRDIQQNDNSESLRSATLLLVQVNNQVAVFAGSYPQKSAALWSNLVEHLRDQYIYLLHSISFKNYKPNPVPISIIGKWAAKSSSTGSFYEFYSNGTFSWSGGTSFKTRYDDTHDKVTITTRANDGKWSLKGNELTIYYNTTKKTSQYKLRLYYDKNLDGTWMKRLGWFSIYEGGGFGELSFSPDKD